MALIPRPQSGITDELKEAFQHATPFEIRLATAFIYFPNRKEALAAINADEKHLKDDKLWRNVDNLIVAIRDDLMLSSIEMMRNHLPQATQVLIHALGSPNERIRVKAAQDLIERFLGKPTTHAVLDVKTQTETVHYHINGIDPSMLDTDYTDENTVEGTYERQPPNQDY